MKKYEAMLVLKPADELTEDTINQVKKLIVSHKGKLDNVDIWGKKTLAYNIDGYTEGFYVLIHFFGNRGLRLGLDHFLKLQENVLRHLVVNSVS